MRVTSNGRVTIPVEIRRQFAITPETEVEWSAQDGIITLRVDQATRRRLADQWIEMEQMSGTANTGLTTGEILAMTRGED